MAKPSQQDPTEPRELARTPEKYIVRSGLNYAAPGGDSGLSGERRAEPGDVIDDLPESSIHWLLMGGHIAPIERSEDRSEEGEN